jgi:hypothetical protein
VFRYAAGDANILLPVRLVLYILCIAGQIACIAHTCSASIAASNRCSPQYASMTQLAAVKDTYSNSFIVFTSQFLDHLLLFQLQVSLKALVFKRNTTCNWHLVPSSPGILLYTDKVCVCCACYDCRINIEIRQHAESLIDLSPFSY